MLSKLRFHYDIVGEHLVDKKHTETYSINHQYVCI